MVEVIAAFFSHWFEQLLLLLHLDLATWIGLWCEAIVGNSKRFELSVHRTFFVFQWLLGSCGSLNSLSCYCFQNQIPRNLCFVLFEVVGKLSCQLFTSFESEILKFFIFAEFFFCLQMILLLLRVENSDYCDGL